MASVRIQVSALWSAIHANAAHVYPFAWVVRLNFFVLSRALSEHDEQRVRLRSCISVCRLQIEQVTMHAQRLPSEYLSVI